MVQQRTGRDQLVRLWTPVKLGLTVDYMTVGDVQGRWEPAASAKPGDWREGDEILFIKSKGQETHEVHVLALGYVDSVVARGGDGNDDDVVQSCMRPPKQHLPRLSPPPPRPPYPQAPSPTPWLPFYDGLMNLEMNAVPASNEASKPPRPPDRLLQGFRPSPPPPPPPPQPMALVELVRCPFVAGCTLRVSPDAAALAISLAALCLTILARKLYACALARNVRRYASVSVLVDAEDELP